MKKLSVIFTIFLCLFAISNVHAFSQNIGEQSFEDLGSPFLRYVFRAHPDQINIEEGKMSLDVNGVIYPIKKLYIESGQIFAEALLNVPSLDSEFVISITCPKCHSDLATFF